MNIHSNAKPVFIAGTQFTHYTNGGLFDVIPFGGFNVEGVGYTFYKGNIPCTGTTDGVTALNGWPVIFFGNHMDDVWYVTYTEAMYVTLMGMVSKNKEGSSIDKASSRVGVVHMGVVYLYDTLQDYIPLMGPMAVPTETYAGHYQSVGTALVEKVSGAGGAYQGVSTALYVEYLDGDRLTYLAHGNHIDKDVVAEKISYTMVWSEGGLATPEDIVS
jgi:hypothetical protein